MEGSDGPGPVGATTVDTGRARTVPGRTRRQHARTRRRGPGRHSPTVRRAAVHRHSTGRARTPGRRSGWRVAGTVLAAVLAAATVTRVATAATSPPAHHAALPTAPPGSPPPPPVPAHGAYLGAFVAPHANENVAQSDVRLELAQLGNFDGAAGRPLGLVHVYQPWATPVKTSVLAGLASTGATPMVDWTCTSTASIISGSQDALITSYANALRAYDRPVFLRWFWEMNLTYLPRTSGCLGSLGSSGYVQAWQHIWTIFRTQGATNVAFVWCPSINGTNYSLPYYPGDAYVDWIGWDGYDRKQSPTMLQTQFLPFYDFWVTHGKPLVIGETGATTDQATYLAQLQAVLPVTFPQVHALLYYDSKSDSDWTLTDSPGNLGFTQFVALGQTPYFQYPYTGT